jgi:bla regulator protein blaR1
MHTFTYRLVQAFSWMLIHSLWQGLFLALVAGLVLMLTKKSSPAFRYNLVFTQLVIFIAGCTCTFIWEWNNNPWNEVVQPVSGALHLSNNMLSGFTAICAKYFSANAPVILFIWSIFFIARTVKVMGGLVYVSRARHRNVYGVEEVWKQKIALLCEQLQLKKAVTLLESGYVKMPLVIGHFKPVILIPLGMLSGLPVNQIEAVLLHELAHIRRNDYFINLLQHVAEAVFFFNPGLLWISSLLRDEREHCCDDMALEQTKNKRAFIEALISFKEHTVQGYAVAFPGRKDHLLQRVSRILNNKNNTLNAGEKLFCMSGVLILTLILSAAGVMEMKTQQRIVKKKEKVTIIHHNIITTTSSTPKPPAVVKIRRRVIAVDQAAAVHEKQLAEQERQQADRDRQQADRDREQADRDREQADRERAQADKDYIQAVKDRAAADRVRAQADRDRVQADNERMVAERERLRVERTTYSVQYRNINRDRNRGADSQY